MNPAMVSCPNCNAMPGQVCTRPTITGRAPVSWFHSSREELAMAQAQVPPIDPGKSGESFTARSLKRQLENLHRGPRIEVGESYTTSRHDEPRLLVNVSDLETLTGIIHDLINEGAI